jgi:hypothetical protein
MIPQLGATFAKRGAIPENKASKPDWATKFLVTDKIRRDPSLDTWSTVFITSKGCYFNLKTTVNTAAIVPATDPEKKEMVKSWLYVLWVYLV